MNRFGRITFAAAATAALFACAKPQEDRETPGAEAVANAVPAEESAAPASTAKTDEAAPAVLAAELTRAEWTKAKNRDGCAPLALIDDGSPAGTPRAAAFSGGWGIAFDTKAERSAYGVAGAGIELGDFATEVERIHGQWPYVRPLGGRAGKLPGGAIAGYGLDGAAPLPDDAPTGKGQKMGAYVLIPGQRCLYNLWDTQGRDHLEAMLDRLTLLDTSASVPGKADTAADRD